MTIEKSEGPILHITHWQKNYKTRNEDYLSTKISRNSTINRKINADSSPVGDTNKTKEVSIRIFIGTRGFKKDIEQMQEQSQQNPKVVTREAILVVLEEANKKYIEATKNNHENPKAAFTQVLKEANDSIKAGKFDEFITKIVINETKKTENKKNEKEKAHVPHTKTESPNDTSRRGSDLKGEKTFQTHKEATKREIEKKAELKKAFEDKLEEKQEKIVQEKYRDFKKNEDRIKRQSSG